VTGEKQETCYTLKSSRAWTAFKCTSWTGALFSP